MTNKKRILNLDDLIKEDLQIQLNGNTYYFNTSFKSVLKYQKWTQEHLNGKDFNELSEEALEMMVDIIIKNNEEFKKDFAALNSNSQAAILSELILSWIKEVFGESTPSEEEDGKK